MKGEKAMTNFEQELINVANTEVWGTVGEKFHQANRTLCQICSAKHAIVTFSLSAALESVLRGFDVGFGDSVVLAAKSEEYDTAVTLCVGAAPIYCDCLEDGFSIDPQRAKEAIKENTKAIIADLPCDIKDLNKTAREKGIKLIINANDRITQADLSLCDAAVIDMSSGCAFDADMAGAVLCNSDDDYDRFYAHHNCGRPLGDGNTLDFDDMVGGDLRIAEWQAALICMMSEPLPPSKNHPEKRPLMAYAPLHGSEYVKKLTGGYPLNKKGDFPNAEK
jgi:dTDP-4-amino-4,6-dideoxygalactose transaminase